MLKADYLLEKIFVYLHAFSKNTITKSAVMKRFFAVFLLALSLCFHVKAQVPAGYYNDAIGLSGRALHEALARIITEGHQVVGYDELWDYFPLTDPAAEDSSLINDMYSLCRFQPDQYGDGEGCFADSCICFQREHTFCQSWFGYRADAPFSDIHHIHPVDGGINGSRSNYPYGEVDISQPFRRFNNTSLRGYNATSSDYTGIVYEPIDEYKGDIARMLFYMTTRYLLDDDGFSHEYEMTDGSQLRPWALQMLLRWNVLDPVSEKEIRRNNVIYDQIQHNRNPFIDHPELADLIWTSDSLTSAFSENYVPVVRPHLASYEVNSANSITFVFDSEMVQTTLAQTANYTFNRNIQTESVVVDAPNQVTVTLASDLAAGLSYYCYISNLQALGGQFIRDTAVTFTYGFSANHTVLAGWTFDELTENTLGVERSMPANVGLLSDEAMLYWNGQYGSSIISYNSDEDYSDIRAYAGTPIGDPRAVPYSGRALAFQHRANGKAFVLAVPTQLYRNLLLTFALWRTNTGATEVFYEWSADGENYTALGDTVSLLDVLEPQIFVFQNIDLQEIDELEDQPMIYLRVSVDGANSSFSSGNIRFDNLCVRGEKCVTNTFIFDTIAQGAYYSRHGFHFQVDANQTPGTMQYTRQQEVDGVCDSLFTLLLTITVGVNDMNEPQFQIYPNPAHETIVVEGSGLMEARIYNEFGQEVGNYLLNGLQKNVLSVNSLPAGIYFVKVIAADGRKATRKVVVQ